MPSSGPPQLPVTGQILGTKNDARAAADVDPPQRAQILRIDRFLGMPDRVLRRQQPQFVFLFWKHLAHQLAKTLLEIAAAATGLAQDKSAAIDVVAQALLLLGGELRRLPAADE